MGLLCMDSFIDDDSRGFPSCHMAADKQLHNTWSSGILYKYIIKHYAFSGNNLIHSIVFSMQNENDNYNNYNYHFNPV